MSNFSTRPDGTLIAVDEPHSVREIARRASDARIRTMLGILGAHPRSLESAKSGLMRLRRQFDLDDVDRMRMAPFEVQRVMDRLEVVDALLTWVELGVREELAFHGEGEDPQEASARF